MFLNIYSESETSVTLHIPQPFFITINILKVFTDLFYLFVSFSAWFLTYIPKNLVKNILYGCWHYLLIYGVIKKISKIPSIKTFSYVNKMKPGFIPCSGFRLHVSNSIIIWTFKLNIYLRISHQLGFMVISTRSSSCLIPLIPCVLCEWNDRWWTHVGRLVWVVTHELNMGFIMMCQTWGLCVKVVLITSAEFFSPFFMGGHTHTHTHTSQPVGRGKHTPPASRLWGANTKEDPASCNSKPKKYSFKGINIWFSLCVCLSAGVRTCVAQLSTD